jgi:sugar phosphate isomerase/epimerase
MTRRNLIASATTTMLAQTGSAAASKPRLGLDLFSLRSQGWDAFQFLDFAARHKIETVHFSEIRFMGSLEDEHLKKVRAKSEEHGIQIEMGMRSICPTSKAFDPKQGTAEQQIQKMIHAAKTVGSPIVRCFLGTFADRENGDIDRNIENTVKVLKAVRSQVRDSGLKIAVENHAGDMQARELKGLVEAAGKDFVGVCLDSGNPLWAIEDPHLTLETLAPYVVTSHVRDTSIWRTPEGAAVQWTRMGDGNIDIDGYLTKFQQLCPGKSMSLEIIVTGPRIYPFQSAKFWEPYRKTPAWEFSRFLALADRGTARPTEPPVPKERVAEKERNDLETSIRYTKEFLKL